VAIGEAIGVNRVILRTVDKKTVQLLTRGEPPEWWHRLMCESGLDVQWTTGPRLNPRASVMLVARKELTDFRKEEFSLSKAYILTDENWTAQNLKRALNTIKGALFLNDKLSPVEIGRVISVALARQTERERHAELMQMMRLQNRQIEELNRGLEQVVKERTVNEAESRRASQKNISRMRDIIGFIKELSQVFDIGDIVPLIRRHVKEHHLLEAPVLFIPRGEDAGDFYHLRASEPVRSRVRVNWIVSSRIRVNDPEDSQFLANGLGRPFGKVLRFPLITVRHQKDSSLSPLLMFEHNLAGKELDGLVATLAEKLQPVSWALDRLILEQELKSTSRDWEMTFDELSEPIAILDHDGRVLRGNAHWRDEFKSVLHNPSAQLRVGELLYAVEKYPIRMSADGPPISWVVYLRDETRSRRLKSQVVQIEKMSAIGQLAGHIAHELNNPLTGIRSLSQVLISDTDAESQVHKDLVEVERAAARCQGIINNLLDFSKGGIEHKVRAADLNDITRKTLPFLKSAIGRFRNDIELSDSELHVKVEPQLMQQVIFNLVNNACQAMKEKGEVRVRTRSEGKWAILEVEDTGPGVPAELKERIFEPFFTTKAKGEGTGLGLSLSRDFVRQVGGELECESEIGTGSVFRVRLPLLERP
jgi:two-component system NtrC family sensor kinase